MLRTSCFLFATMMSISAFGEVSLEDKLMRLDTIKKINESSSLFSGLEREIQYEKKNYTLDMKAQLEANLVAERIKSQITSAFEMALNETGSADEAYAEVKSAVEKDLSLVSPDVKAELQTYSMDVLGSLQNGGVSSQVTSLPEVEKKMAKNIKKRSDLLNMGGAKKSASSATPEVNDAEKRIYVSKKELLESLISDKSHTRWVSAANTMDRAFKRFEDRKSYSIRTDFMGSPVDVGTEVKFRREFSTAVTVMAEGLNPVLMKNGNFDFYKRDNKGKIVSKDNVPQKRFMAFICDAELYVEAELSGKGAIKFMGVGIEGAMTDKKHNSVMKASRRIFVPEYVDNTTVTIKYLNDLRHDGFLNSKIENNFTVKQLLELEMENLLENLTFSHPQTKCVADEHCQEWFYKANITLARHMNVPRCVEEKREKYMACALRGVKGQNCKLVKDGKVISDGLFEFTCDKGLKCVQTSEGGWFQDFKIYVHPKGQCLPVKK